MSMSLKDINSDILMFKVYSVGAASPPTKEETNSIFRSQSLKPATETGSIPPPATETGSIPPPATEPDETPLPITETYMSSLPPPETEAVSETSNAKNTSSSSKTETGVGFPQTAKAKTGSEASNATIVSYSTKTETRTSFSTIRKTNANKVGNLKVLDLYPFLNLTLEIPL